MGVGILGPVSDERRIAVEMVEILATAKFGHPL